MAWLDWRLLVMTANWLPVTALYEPYEEKMPALWNVPAVAEEIGGVRVYLLMDATQPVVASSSKEPFGMKRASVGTARIASTKHASSARFISALPAPLEESNRLSIAAGGKPSLLFHSAGYVGQL
jgi:hypothetical protein